MAGATFTFTLSILCKATLVLILALMLSTLLRRERSATRHRHWLCCLLVLLLLPLIALVTPKWHLPLSSPWSDAPPTNLESKANLPIEMFAHSRQPLPLAKNPHRLESSAPTVSEPWSPSPALLILWLWGVGAIVFASPLILGQFRLRYLARVSKRITSGPLWEALETARVEIGARSVLLLQSHSRSMPMTWGWFRPVILLPTDASTWSSSRLRLVLFHELAHVRRRDCLTQCLAILTRAVYWFHPLVWIVVAQLRQEQEQACDEVVLASGAKATDYAEHLIAVTSGVETSRFLSSVTLAMARVTRLERRLLAMFKGNNERTGKGRWIALLFLLMIGAIAMIAFSEARAEAPSQPKKKGASTQAILDELQNLIRQRAVKQLSKEEMLQGAIKGILAELKDPYSQHLTDQDLQLMRQQIRGKFFGIGASLEMKSRELHVQFPLDGSPAAKAGIQPGDVILEVDDKPLKGLALSECVLRIVGKEGTKVTLKIRRQGKVQSMTLTRATVQSPVVVGIQRGADNKWSFVLDEDLKLGYIRILSFSSTTLGELKKALASLQKKGLKGLVIDLRFCPGGLLQSAIECSDLFLDEGVIVTLKGRKDTKSWKAKKEGTAEKIPMMVLINGSTASAGEIFAGALRDHKRAILLGSRTLGKGSVQSLVPLKEIGGAVKLTTAHYFLPSNRNITKKKGSMVWGVDPHDGYYVPLGRARKQLQANMSQRNLMVGKWKPIKKITSEIASTKLDDSQLAAAIESMTLKLTKGDFVKTGQRLSVLKADLAWRAQVEKKRKKLLDELDRLHMESRP